MRFGIKTLDEFEVAGKTVLCRVDLNQPVDRETGTLKSTARVEACVPTVRELSDKGAKVVLLAHQGSDIEYKNYYNSELASDISSNELYDLKTEGRYSRVISPILTMRAKRTVSPLTAVPPKVMTLLSARVGLFPALRKVL